MGIMVHSLLWVMQGLYHQPYVHRPSTPFVFCYWKAFAVANMKRDIQNQVPTPCSEWRVLECSAQDPHGGFL